MYSTRAYFVHLNRRSELVLIAYTLTRVQYSCIVRTPKHIYSTRAYCVHLNICTVLVLLRTPWHMYSTRACSIHIDICTVLELHRHGGVSGSALACGACKTCLRPGFESRVKRASKFRKFQTALSTTERYLTLSVVCLIVECTKRQRNGK